MGLFWILLIILAIIVLLVLVAAYICFYLAFYTSRKEAKSATEFDLPPGKIYEPYHGVMLKWMKEVRALPHTEYSVTSFDGLVLRAKYYEHTKGAPVEIMFHGYRGSAERDLCGGVQRCFALGRNVLMVDQRASGSSEGKIITLGVNESRDCLTWVDFSIKTFGSDVKIILTGISMGAATVIMAAGKSLPENVVGVLADCGYTTARDMIKKTIKEMKLPSEILYPFVKLGARIFGKFDLEETSPIEAVKNCKVPVFFVHGEADGFVPCYMSKLNFEACPSAKTLFTVAGADHGLAYPADPENYLSALAAFFTEAGVPTEVVKL